MYIMKEVRFDKYCRLCKYSDTNEADKPCCYCLETSYRECSQRPINYVESERANYLTGMPAWKYKVKDYLYFLDYNELDYDYAYEYYKNNTPIVPMACSSLRNGQYYGRKLDWVYSNQAEFVVRTPKTSTAYATIGVAGGLSKLTEDFVASNGTDELFKVVPFQLYDGMNEMGLTANINVVPTDHGENVSIPLSNKTDTLSALQVIRYILDRFASAYTAAAYIRDHLEIHFPKQLHKMNYELHYMIADMHNKTYCVEFVDNEAKIIDISKKPYMTNFHLYGVKFNDDGTVYTPETQDEDHNASKTNLITDNGSGLERYNLIARHYDEACTLNGMFDILNSLDYTRAYPSSDNPALHRWYTEFVGARNLTVASPASDYEPVVSIADGYFRERTRQDGRTWHSMHSSIYDTYRGTLYLQTQEDHSPTTFSIH